MGKTHLVIALAVKAAETGHRVTFLTLEKLMAIRKKAQQESRRELVPTDGQSETQGKRNKTF